MDFVRSVGLGLFRFRVWQHPRMRAKAAPPPLPERRKRSHCVCWVCMFPRKSCGICVLGILSHFISGTILLLFFGDLIIPFYARDLVIPFQLGVCGPNASGRLG